MRELICRIVGPDAQVVDAFNQIKARMVHMTAVGFGTFDERTSYARVEDENGTMVLMTHVDEFGIVRDGDYITPDPYPIFVQPTGAHDSYPINRLDGQPTKVLHNGKIYQNTAGTVNSWAPGVFGWTEVAE